MDTVTWHTLANDADLDRALTTSHERPVLLFKHSVRCSISAMALDRVQRGWVYPAETLEPWLLDLLRYPEISKAIAVRLGVVHQSPQAILLRHGRVVWHASHSGISVSAISEALEGMP